MTILEAIEQRHSVRSYLDKKIPLEVVGKLQEEINACNKEGNLHIQLVTNESKAFDGMMAHYGKFKGVQNYIALVGKKASDLDEKLGYYGERIVLLAQMLGLNTCWVAMTVSKGVVKKNIEIAGGEKLGIVISLGYGESQGVPHKSKSMEALAVIHTSTPQWFIDGMKSVMCAPTAMNQQKFVISYEDKKVNAKSLGGFYSKVDLGIVKYHFEVGAGKENFDWGK